MSQCEHDASDAANFQQCTAVFSAWQRHGRAARPAVDHGGDVRVESRESQCATMKQRGPPRRTEKEPPNHPRSPVLHSASQLDHRMTV